MGSFFICIVVVLFSALDAAKFPPNWKKCKLGPDHNNCMRDAIQHALPDLVKGIPSLGLMPIDPLRFTKLIIKQGNGPVSVDLEFTDMDITGLTNEKVTRVQNNWKQLTFDVTAPVLKIKSKYSINGKVLILPVRGKGDCTLDMEKFNATLIFNMNEKVVGSKTYYNVVDMKISVDANPLRMHFENLFDGNKELGDQFNNFVNENWKEIFEELKPVIEEALVEAGTDMATRFFKKVPKNEITPPS